MINNTLNFSAIYFSLHPNFFQFRFREVDLIQSKSVVKGLNHL